MKQLKTILVFLIIGMLSSCIQDEALNAEADITACIVDPDILKKDPIVLNNRVQLFVKSDTDITQQAPAFELTPGASISPESGTLRDFRSPQTYTVI